MFLILIFSILLFIDMYMKRKQNFWKEIGIPQDEPKSIFHILFQTKKKENIMISLSRYYHKAKNNGFPFYGLYFLHKPMALATDLDFIRTVMVKDFNNFMNRGMYSNEEDDPLSADLPHLESHRWKQMSSKLTPTFTSGKIRYMHPMVVSVGEKLISSLNAMIKNKNVVEIKGLAARYTTDVIGNVVYGVDFNSLEDSNSIFRTMGKQIFETPKLTIIQHIVTKVFPSLAKWLHIKVQHNEVNDFFMKLVKIVKFIEMILWIY